MPNTLPRYKYIVLSALQIYSAIADLVVTDLMSQVLTFHVTVIKFVLNKSVYSIY